MRKELTGVVQAISGKRRFLVRFHDGCEKNLSSNQLTIVAAHEILVEEAPLVSTIPVIPEDKMKVIRGTMFVSMLYYSLKRRTKLTIRRSRWNCRLILMKMRRMTLISTTRGSVTGEMFSKDNEGGVDKKALLHAKRWDLYLNER